MNKNIYSVGKVNAYIKQMFAEDFLLRDIAVKGEVSNCRYHTSGHIYFTIKDHEGALSAIMFKGNRVQGLRFPMKDGDRVIVHGSVSVYEKGGTYQIYAREISLDGAGDLYVRFEQLKKELEEMGMFAPEYKKPIPKYATRIGIVTAPTGAAVRDIIQISKRRNPYVTLILYPALVQGEGATESIISGIMALDEMHLDVLIVGRGGGSIEDLWAFNEEPVARAIFNCNTPVISAVGHETDTTICDYVADLRAPTPSAAAEQAVFSYEDWKHDIEGYQMMLGKEIAIKLSACADKITNYGKQLRYLCPTNRLNENRQYALTLEQHMEQAFMRKIEQKRSQMALLAERLDGMSPMKKLSQGYSYTTDADGQNLASVKQAHLGGSAFIYVKDGVIETKITGVNEEVSWKKN